MKRNPEFFRVKICFTGIYFDKPELTLALDHLYYYEEYSVKEISNLTARKESTIQSRLAAARQKLKSMLEESKGDPI